MKTLFVALAMIITFTAQAQDFSFSEARTEAIPPGIVTQKLFDLANDRDAKTYHQLSIMVDTSNNVAGIYMEKMSTQTPENLTPADGVSWLRDIESKEGAVLFEGQGKKVILLQGTLDRATQQGRFNVRFLTNGLQDTYSACDLLLMKDDKGWFIQNAYAKKKVTNAKIITWSLGVTTIQGICPKTF